MKNRNFNGLKEMSGGTFDGIDFNKCTFIGADLSNATFTNSYMQGCDFTNAKMDGITMDYVNMRESKFVGASMQYGIMTNNMLCRSDFTDVDGRHVDFTGSDLRTCNFRNAFFPNADFTDCFLKGIAMRGTRLEHAKIHEFFVDYSYQFRIMEPDAVCYAWKLTQQDGYGIYHPRIKYKVGTVAYAEEQEDGNKPLDPDARGENTNPGIAIAPIDWVLREWNMMGANPLWKIFMVSFNAGDVIKSKGNCAGFSVKFNVKRIKIEKEVPIKQFYEEMKD